MICVLCGTVIQDGETSITETISSVCERCKKVASFEAAPLSHPKIKSGGSERDEKTEAVRNVEKTTDSKPVREERLLPSRKVKRQLQEPREQSKHSTSRAR